MTDQINVERLARRTAYLAVTGIDSWVPRRSLEGADSHIYLIQQTSPDSLPAPENPVPKVGSASTARHKLITEVMQETSRTPLPADDKSLTTHVDSDATDDSSTDSSPKATVLPSRFELSVSIMGDFIILDDISKFSSAPSTYHNWLAALSLVLSSSQSPANTPEQLRWPEVMGGVEAVSPKSPSGALRSARELVQTWMLRQFEHQPRNLILMGAMPCLLFDEQAFREWVAQNPELAGLQVLRTLSSMQVWESVANKRQFWLQLTSLNRE